MADRTPSDAAPVQAVGDPARGIDCKGGNTALVHAEPRIGQTLVLRNGSGARTRID